ncbi:transcription factor Hsf1 [Rhodotorula diobovata]|uniref:Transcription factor Hsf1 n=1 Tax=Rhodotorula diobovata TaxID=5288 RepID=A0A5C5G451_9BASI|nr:transcription factor Hsf1 [Rhodotorula diobovata]
MPRPRKAAPAHPPPDPPAATTAANSGMQLTLAGSQLPLAPPALPVRAKPNKETTKNVPAFLTKLFTMVSDPGTDDLIRWSEDGDSFFVPSADRMGRELLPHYFKHQNFGSFVRQLNMYGFHKVPHLQQGVLKRDTSEDADMLEFSNANFQRGQPDLLCMIHRKVKGDGAVVPAAGDGTLDLSSLVNDLAAIRKHQTAISADLKELQARNHALWQEAVQSREKHKKQEETINKILRFLAGVFGGHVLDQGGAAPSPQVQGEATTPDQAPGVGPGKGAKVVMPKGRLLLEDVKGRQSAALRELDGSDEEIEEIPLLRGDDDELPTISSSLVASAPTAGMGTLARAPSHSRFTSIASPASSSALPTPTDGTGVDPAQYGLTPEAFGALVGRTGDSSAFHALFNQQGSSSSSSSAPEPSLTMPASSSSSSSTALLPYVPTTTSNPLENPFALFAPSPPAASTSAMTSSALSSSAAPTSSTSSSAPAMSPSVASALAQNNSAVATLLSEKADIDSRTSALEAQIARLMENLPDDAREQVENDQPLGVGGAAGDGAAGGTEGDGQGGMDWSKFALDDGGIDFDKMLAQFSEIANPSSSYNFLPSTSSYDPSSSSGAGFPTGVTDYSDILSSSAPGNSLHAVSSTDPPLDPALFSSAAASSTFPYEVTSPASSVGGGAGAGGTLVAGSPASTADSAPTPASTTSDAAPTGTSKQGGAAAGARKRKSDALGGADAPSPGAASPAASDEGGAAGTRRSQRRRRA